MDTLKKNLEQREQPELIAIIQHMLRQEPDLQWLLKTPLPTATTQKSSLTLNPEVYRQQVLAAMAAGENLRKRKRGEVERRLTAIKSIADEFVAQETYTAALSIYEVLISEVIEHFNTYQDEYIAFCVILTGCVDGLDSCFAGEADDQRIRLRVLKTLFAIYRFYTESEMDLDEDIPGLLVGNTTPEERQVIAGWVRDALAHKTAWSNSQQFETLLAALASDTLSNQRHSLSSHVYFHDSHSAQDVRAAPAAEVPVLHAPQAAPPTHPYTYAR